MTVIFVHSCVVLSLPSPGAWHIISCSVNIVKQMIAKWKKKEYFILFYVPLIIGEY